MPGIDVLDLAVNGSVVITSGGVLQNVTIAATQLTGNLPVARFNGGTGASSSTFWRGDMTWVSLASAAVAAAAVSTGSTSLPNATQTAILFDTDTFDTDSIHSTSSNTERFVAPTNGKYAFVVKFQMHGGNSSNRYARIRMNGPAGSTYDYFRETSASPLITISLFAVVPMTAGEYLAAYAEQDSGSSVPVYEARGFFYRLGD